MGTFNLLIVELQYNLPVRAQVFQADESLVNVKLVLTVFDHLKQPIEARFLLGRVLWLIWPPTSLILNVRRQLIHVDPAAPARRDFPVELHLALLSLLLNCRDLEQVLAEHHLVVKVE